MSNIFARLDALADDELSSAREAFRRALAQKVAEAGSSGNRFSTSLSASLANLGIEDLRRRTTKLLECVAKLPNSSIASLRLNKLSAWAEQRLSQEAADIEMQVEGVHMGRIAKHADFLEDEARSSSRRLSAELASLHAMKRESDLDEAPWFVRMAKWIVTRGPRNLHWIGLGVALLVALGLVSILLPQRVASLLGIEKPPAVPQEVDAARVVWRQNWLTVNESLPWMGSSDGTSATNREQLLGVLSSLDLNTTPEISNLRGELVAAVQAASRRSGDAVYDMEVSPDIAADLRSLRRAIRSQAIAAGVQIERRE
jgi:hypothetical protein